MLSSVEQAFVGWEEIRAPLKTPAWEASESRDGGVVRLHVNAGYFLPYLSGLPNQPKAFYVACFPLGHL